MPEHDQGVRSFATILVGITVGLVVARLFVAVGMRDEAVALGLLSGAVASLAFLVLACREPIQPILVARI